MSPAFLFWPLLLLVFFSRSSVERLVKTHLLTKMSVTFYPPTSLRKSSYREQVVGKFFKKLYFIIHFPCIYDTLK